MIVESARATDVQGIFFPWMLCVAVMIRLRVCWVVLLGRIRFCALILDFDEK